MMTSAPSRATAKTLEYEFRYYDQCNMCGSGQNDQRIWGRRLNTRQGYSPKSKVGIATTVLRCGRCGLIYANPMPVPRSIQQHYGITPESYWGEAFTKLTPDYLRPQITQFEAIARRNIRGAGLTALDVGVGIGKGMIALTAAGFDTYGVEPSEPFYQRAVEVMGIPESRLKLAMVEDVEFADESFDFINMAAVVEHLYDPSRVLARAVHWLKPGGLIYVQVPSSAYLMSRLARYFYRATGSDYVINLCPMHAPYHLYEFTLQSFLLHAQAHRYQVVGHQFLVCGVYLPKLLNNLFELLMKWTDTGMQLEVWLTR